MMMMATSYTFFAKYFNRIIEKHCAFGEISKKIGAFVDSYCASAPDVFEITLALTACIFNNFPLFSIIKFSVDDSCHTNTPNLIAVMIDANHRLAYPLAKRLEGRVDGISIKKGSKRNNE